MKKQKDKNKIKYNFGYDFIKVTGIIPAYIWVRPKIIREGEQSKKVKGGMLIASNHVTFIDPIIMHLAFPSRRLYSVATKDVMGVSKFRQFFFKFTNCIFIDRQNFSTANLHTICNVLKKDKAVMIFPESKINFDDGVKEYKSGVVLMAALSKKPIIPVCIIKNERWYQRTKVIIGEPVYVTPKNGFMLTIEEIEDITKTLQAKEKEMLEKYQPKTEQKD